MKPKCKHCKEEIGNTLMEILLHEEDCISNPANKPQDVNSYSVDPLSTHQ